MRNLIFACAILGVTVLSGCASSGTARSSDTVSALADTQRSGERINERIDEVLTDLDSIVAAKGADPRPAFKDYKSDLAKLESDIDKARKNSMNMQASAERHYTAWMQELEGVQNEDIRALSEERRTDFMSAFEDLRTQASEAKAAFDPFMSDLRDIAVYLDNSLNKSGIEAIAPTIERAKANGAKVKNEIDGVLDSLKGMRSQYQASTPAG